MKPGGELEYQDNYVRSKEYTICRKYIKRLVKELSFIGFNGTFNWELYSYKFPYSCPIIGGVSEISKKQYGGQT